MWGTGWKLGTGGGANGQKGRLGSVCVGVEAVHVSGVDGVGTWLTGRCDWREETEGKERCG